MIRFNEASKVFTLSTKHTAYQMQVDKYGILKHLYYGADIGDTELVDIFVGVDRGTSPNIYEADNEREYSLDTMPQEYSGEGNGDYRVTAIEAEYKDGSSIVDLRYHNHKIYDGKYALAGMPAMFSDTAMTLEVELLDKVSGLMVTLLYGVLEDVDIITKAVKVKNTGKDSVRLQKVLSGQLDFTYADMDLVHFYGKHNKERITERVPLLHGIQSIASKRGTSSHQHNPFVILCDKNANEDYGNAYAFALVYSGGFTFDIEVDQAEQTRIVGGIQPYNFVYTLEEGEEFIAPEFVMSYSKNGFASLSHNIHDGYRKHLIRSPYVDQPRPILVNNWEATYFDFDEEKLFNIAKIAKEIGLDMLVMDDGWFGKREGDVSGLGDWFVNEEKLKGGLAALVDRIHGIDMKFGIWVEPEMISEDSDLYRAHPDWCLRIPNRDVIRGRYQLNLDISRKEVRDYIMESIFKVFDSTQIDYVKWDMNRAIANVYSLGLSADRQGEVLHRYILGLYEMQEALITRYPNILFENCSGGGGRFDPAMLYYSPQIWCSDDTDALERIRIQYGSSFAYPISTMGAHVSACPNHQTGRDIPFETRAVVAHAGTFGYELDLENLSEEEKEIARKNIVDYKRIENLVQTGDYYRLTNPFTNTDFAMWQFVSKDKKRSIAEGVMIFQEPNPRIRYIRFKGLKPEGHYKEINSGKIYSGAALMHAGFPLPHITGDYKALSFEFEEV